MSSLTATQLHLTPTVVTERMTAAVHALVAVCPTAPPGMQGYQDQMIGWVKWGVIALIGIAALCSVGAIAVGKILHMPHASGGGAIGLAVTLIAAILFVAAPSVVSGIIGSGC